MRAETERLILREWQESDIEPFIALNQDLSVMEFFPAVLSPDETRAFIERIRIHFQKHGFGLWALELKSTSEFIGFVGLNIPGFEAKFTPCVEIGWRLSSAHWGKGYALEAARKVLELGFATYNLKEIVSFTSIHNKRSIRVMEKLGMMHDSKDDFEHPKLPKEDYLAKHVLYRIRHVVPVTI
ncbi:MAG: GNAT family N-acetyltransferase [Gammaproteobacteria bacterium]|nr:GNAT family N-acetyltransferase [Gammaproteobacteria bacterium]